MKKISILGLGFILSLLSLVCVAQEGLKIDEILKTNESWDGSTLPVLPAVSPEVSVKTLTIPPGAILPVHLHPLFNVAYMLSGELKVIRTIDPNGNFSDSDNVEQITLHAGDAVVETFNTWHYGENTGKEDVKILLIYVGASGTPESLIIPQS